MVPISSYADIATFVFCLALLVLTLNVARNRHNFHSTLQAPFLPRVRSQFFRESKFYNEWCFYFGTGPRGLFLVGLASLLERNPGVRSIRGPFHPWGGRFTPRFAIP